MFKPLVSEKIYAQNAADDQDGADDVMRGELFFKEKKAGEDRNDGGQVAKDGHFGGLEFGKDIVGQQGGHQG